MGAQGDCVAVIHGRQCSNTHLNLLSSAVAIGSRTASLVKSHSYRNGIVPVRFVTTAAVEPGIPRIPDRTENKKRCVQSQMRSGSARRPMILIGILPGIKLLFIGIAIVIAGTAAHTATNVQRPARKA